MKLTDFLRDVGQPMPYYPSLARLIGVKECVLLCRLIWWHGRQADPDGWIFKTRDELSDETGLSHEEQATARKKLRAQGLIAEREERLRHKHFYRVEFAALDSLWEVQPDRLPDAGVPGVGKPRTTAPSKPVVPAPTIGAEDTQKTLTTPAPSAAEPKASAHTAFVNAWGDAYLEAFGDPYIFAGGKDGSAVKRLLKSGLPTDDLLALARAAWSRGHLFNCKQAASIAGFASRLNDIRAELRGAKPVSSDLAGWENEVNGTK